MTLLDRITVVIIDCYNYGGAVAAIKKTLEQIIPKRTVFLTDLPLKVEGVEVIQIPSITSKETYSWFVIKELYKYFDTDYVLLIQHDGYVINGKSWDNEFYDYDFIGAPWLYPDKDRNVGNGGVSLRSKKLQVILGTDENIEVIEPEDEIIGRLYRRYLEEKHGIKFPSEEIADHFSYELRTPVYDTFAFHGWFHKPYQPTVVIKREAALGDVICVEPALHYFFKKGYRVVLDTLPQFHLIFVNHYFKVHKIDEIDNRLLKTAKTYNLDLSYESKPQQLHLKTYYEFCGVNDGEIRNPKLSVGFPVDEKTKIFPQKYCIIHVDNREQPGRNIYGVYWEKVVEFLRRLGYLAIQVGRDKTATIKDAIQLTATNENFLSYACAGASLFVGIDSGISHICAAYNIPSVILSGSVDISLIHPNMDHIEWVHNHHKKPCDKPFCWNTVIGTTGTPCYIDDKKPPCVQFETEQVLNAIIKIEDRVANV